MPLLLDLSSHISGGLAVLKRFSQRLSRLCGVLETSAEAPDANFQGLHVENLEELFVLLNAVVKSTTNQLDWVYSKIGEIIDNRMIAHKRQRNHYVAILLVPASFFPLKFSSAVILFRRAHRRNGTGVHQTTLLPDRGSKYCRPFGGPVGSLRYSSPQRSESLQSADQLSEICESLGTPA